MMLRRILLLGHTAIENGKNGRKLVASKRRLG